MYYIHYIYKRRQPEAVWQHLIEIPQRYNL